MGAALLLWSIACASVADAKPAPEGWSEGTPPLAADLAVEVHNEHWNPATVWVHWPGLRHFLGDAPAGATTTFQIPADLARRFETLRLHATLTGAADELTTKPIDIQRGHRVEWRLRKVLANSQARVR